MSDPTQPISPPFEIHRPVEVFVVAPQRRRYWLHITLLVLTFFSTLLVGARLQYNFINNQPAFTVNEDIVPMFPVAWIVQHPERLLLGVPFSLTLLFILLAHEMGHYLYCRRYGVYATLPFFIPAPTLIGTLGAFIRIKSPIRSRAALFDIGIAGPIAGFVAATATLIFSLTLSKPMPAGIGPNDIQLGYPLIFDLMHRFLITLGIGGAGAVPLSHAYLHPTAVAAWVGMFATALNLLPGGQLDGGHITYAVFPRMHKTVSRITMLALIPMGVFMWPGWLVWSLLLAISGLRHPNVPPWPDLTVGRKLLALCALVILVLTFMPAPISGEALNFLR